MEALLMLAGAGQIGLVLVSPWVLMVMNWKKETLKLRPIFRQLFNTYAAYILTINLCFGSLSLLRPEWLLDGTPLARAVAGFITAYWGVRLLIEFLYYDRTARPPGFIWLLAEWTLIALFTYWTGIYGFISITGGRPWVRICRIPPSPF
jgi:hypothetical protein